ncbi:MAG: RNA polymerase [Bacteroidetes bacterium]|nr:MAG: RNA polymerase [Bacteroidota bacterium]
MLKRLDYNNTHRELVEECKRGQRKAQFELYRLYSKAMFNICLRMLKNEADAEDVLQASFVDAFTKLDTFRFQSSIGAWIKRIVVNNCINFLKRRKLSIVEMNTNVLSIETPEEDNNPLPHNMSVDKVKSAMMKLPNGYRIVCSLYLLEGYDHKEIAEILDISEATSKSQFSRAKRKLRSMLAEE